MINLKKIIHQWSWIILILFCVLGFWHPVIGMAAIICMLAPVIVAFFRGRMWCGNFCPRGSFNDVILNKISFHHKIPTPLNRPGFRLFFLIALMSAFAVQLVIAWGDAVAVGRVFVRMIMLTTILTIMLGLIFRPRTWCTICPMGTMAYYVSNIEFLKKRIQNIRLDKNTCINCRRCSKSCPMGINVHGYKEKGEVLDANCLKCMVCVEKCPKKSLS